MAHLTPELDTSLLPNLFTSTNKLELELIDLYRKLDEKITENFVRDTSVEFNEIRDQIRDYRSTLRQLKKTIRYIARNNPRIQDPTLKTTVQEQYRMFLDIYSARKKLGEYLDAFEMWPIPPPGADDDEDAPSDY